MKILKENLSSRSRQIKFLHDFIENHKLGVLATVSGRMLPEASVVGIAVLKNLEIIFGSFVNARKVTNLQTNPYVSLAIGWEKGLTVQFEGRVEKIDDLEAEKYLRTTLATIPSIAKYVQREFRLIYRIKPKWVRFADLSRDPWDRFEISFS